MAIFLSTVVIGSVIGGLLLLLLLCCFCIRFSKRRSKGAEPPWDWIMVDSPKEPLIETIFNGDEPEHTPETSGVGAEGSHPAAGKEEV